MKNKRLIKLSAIMLGVLLFFGISRVQASDSFFGDINLTRDNLQAVAAANTLSTDTSIVPITLGISKSEYKTNNGYFYWTIKDSNVKYKDIYCLNLKRGFGMPNGNITDGNSTKKYNDQFDLNTVTDTNYTTLTGLTTENKNKILWILNNSLTSKDSLSTILNVSSEKVDVDSIGLTNKAIEDFIKNDMQSNTRESTKITFNDIKMVQQIAIWHYTNSGSIFDNTIGAICDSEGNQISGLMSENIDIDGYGTYIWNGKVKQAKFNALYQYFIDGAENESSSTVVPTLILSNSNASVSELGTDYIVGPFSLTGENTSLIKTITANVNKNYTLLNSSKTEVNNNDFTKVIGSNFYLKIAKSEITESLNKITIELTYNYDVRKLTFLTNESDPENTQPVVIVESEEKEKNIETDITIELINKTVKKIWDDNKNQDGIRPDFVQVTLYKTVDKIKQKVGEVELNSANNWEYTWNNLSKYENNEEIVYTVEEAVPNNYTASYSQDTFTITNTYKPGTVSKTVVKVWDDKDDADGIRPESVTVQLYANGEKSREEVVLNKENGFTYTWTDLPEKENGEAINYTVSEIKIGNDKVENDSAAEYNVTYKVEGNVITITNTHEVIPKKFDLALRKFITKVNNIEYSREPVVDTSTIATTGTATYKHIKQPIPVQKGDVVTYTIRVYNEGEVDGYVNKITDHLPENLIPILRTTVEDIEKYEEEIEFNENWLWGGDKNIIATEITTKGKASDLPDIIYNETETEAEKEAKQNDARLLKSAYNEDGTIKQELDYIDVQIKCLVTDKAVSGEYLTNIAEITDSQDINGVQGDGIDSELANAVISNLADYKNQEAISSTEDSYVPGQEDDDDFEKLVVKEFDLALRKFITKVNETSYSRQPVVDASKLGTIVDGKIITTASYNHSKEPVIVETNDIVTYKIRIYNEGTIAGYANEITDDIPEGLEFLPNSSVNVSYRWRMLDSEGNETEDVSKAVMIVTDYLSDSDKNNIINAVSENDGVKTLSYKDVEVQFKVIAKAEKLKDNVIKNVAQISSDSDRDIDSNPNRDEKYDYTAGNNEDDIDYEPIKLQYFDLALRKFITKVNTTEYNNRYPEITYNEDGSITYKHTKDPVLVTTNDVVVYTIRVYNEGEKAGYATEITDNLPDGLEFLPENEINKQYGWKLIDSEGNETQDITKAVKFITDCLKEELIDNLVVENGQKILSYKDVQIAFKVIEPNTSDRILVNTAEISADSDDDIDSIPGNNMLEEDDIDREYVKVQYFDLSLKKWVTKTMVTYNGKTTTTKTGFTEDSDDIAKVDLVASKMKKTTVKFAYNIKVTNEGELPGYAYEVKDYIPKGLKFVAEDNKDWKELEDGTVVTEKLKDTLLNPGESATVEIVLTWKNSTTNTGLKTNYAEISKDSADDIDSTPDNYNLKEDDIDDAQVILSIKTAGPQTYVGLILLSVAILAGGIFLIKKYVIK